MTTRTFKNDEEKVSVLCSRTRAILGFRGIKNANRVKVCTNALRSYPGLTMTDDEIAACAQEMATDTQYYTIEYA